jgi:hypothetical protein
MFSTAKSKNGVNVAKIRSSRQPLWKQSSGIRAGAIAAGAPKEPRKPRDRPGSSAFSELEAAREIRPDLEETLCCNFMDQVRNCSRDSALVQTGSRKKPGEARPFFPSGFPHGCAPQESLHRNAEELGLMITLKVQTHAPRRGIDAIKGECAQTSVPPRVTTGYRVACCSGLDPPQ